MAIALGVAVVAMTAQAPEIVPKETKALAEGAARAKDAAAPKPPEPLTQKLEESNGVLKPPKGIDPGFHKAPPAEGTMKVIIPPGTPGGDQSVDPK